MENKSKFGLWGILIGSLLVYYIWKEWLGWDLLSLVYFAVAIVGFLVANIYTDLDNSIEEIKDKFDLLSDEVGGNKDSLSGIKENLGIEDDEGDYEINPWKNNVHKEEKIKTIIVKKNK